MASIVDICNLALSHLGDSATVSSIDPPEGSAQADLCARFFPIALASLLEAHSWGFATRRVALAPLAISADSFGAALPGGSNSNPIVQSPVQSIIGGVGITIVDLGNGVYRINRDTTSSIDGGTP